MMKQHMLLWLSGVAWVIFVNTDITLGNDPPDGNTSTTPQSQAIETPPAAQDQFIESPEMLLFMDIPQVTTVEGITNDWLDSPAAVTVITAEDIRRSGALTLPEALQYVPGLEAVRLNSREWALSIRGYTDMVARYLQVLVDGREVYSPHYGGVFWDCQGIILEDIDRIEVIRGPGATLWGTNAVNGVINIITKRTDKTQGLYTSAGIGNYDRGFSDIRHGGKLDEKTFYRVWGKYFNRDDFEHRDGSSAHDDWDMARSGWRIDSQVTDDTWLNIQGELWHSDRMGEKNAIPDGHLNYRTEINDNRDTGGYAMFKIDKDINQSGGWSLQIYYERQIKVFAPEFQLQHDIVGLDFRHHLKVGDRNSIVWGLGSRMTMMDSESEENLAFIPNQRDACNVNAFVQDTYTLVENEWFAMIGSKFEHNSYTGFEMQPSGRLWWTPDDKQTIWAAVSRPLHTPLRLDWDLNYKIAELDPGLLMGGPSAGYVMPIYVHGDTSVESVEMMAYELGYRRQMTDTLVGDIAGFFYQYKKIASAAAVIPVQILDTIMGKNYGLETSLDWHPSQDVTLGANYSYIHTTVENNTGTVKPSASPHMVRLKALWDITDDLELNTLAYYNDQDILGAAPSFIQLDVGLTWRPTEQLELAFWGKNLVDEHPARDKTLSFTDEIITPTSFYFQATYRF